MTTNKPEVVAWRWRKPVVNDQGETVGETAWKLSDAPEFLPWWTNDPLVRLSDYEALQAECESLRKDAERYRWLRDPCGGAEHVIFYSRGDYGKGLMSGVMLDEAIDHARRIERES